MEASASIEENKNESPNSQDKNHNEQKSENPINEVNNSQDNNDNNESNVSKEEDKECIKEVPQDSELIEEIVKEAIENKNNPNFIPETAKQVHFSLEKNDPRLRIEMKDGSCQLYSFLYVIFRDPSLKRIFEPKVLQTDTDYYIHSEIEGEKYIFRIPLSTIKDEKDKNRGNLFPCDEEYVTALGVFLHALLFMKCGFIDRLAFQPFFSTDAFFDQEIKNVGFGFSLIFNNSNANPENQNKNQENQNEQIENKNQENQNEQIENKNQENVNKSENEVKFGQNENQVTRVNNNDDDQNESHQTKSDNEVQCIQNENQKSVKENKKSAVSLHKPPKMSEISLVSASNKLDLFSDGSIFDEETGGLIEGRHIICISIFPKKNKFGHCLFIFFNPEESRWKLYNNCPHEKYGEYGEVELEQMKSFFFNGSCIIAGVPKSMLK